jgi:hypothetical protein
MKDKVLAYLFRRYIKKIKDEADESANLKFEAYKTTLDINNLIAERYRGIRIGRPNGFSLLEEKLGSLDDDNSRLAFLSKAYDIIKNNETFKVVIDSLIVESIQNAGIDSNDMTSVNFNRAECKGIMLVEEELERLSSMYLTEKEQNKPLTQEEKHEIIS